MSAKGFAGALLEGLARELGAEAFDRLRRRLMPPEAEIPECPAWQDGQHCWQEDPGAKTCACGAMVLKSNLRQPLSPPASSTLSESPDDSEGRPR